MKRIKQIMMLALAMAGAVWCAPAARAGVVASATSAPFALDTRAGTGYVFTARDTEELTYSSLWDTGDPGTEVQIMIETPGNALWFSAGRGEGTVTWSTWFPPRAGKTNTLTHATSPGNPIPPGNMTAFFYVPKKTIQADVTGSDVTFDGAGHGVGVTVNEPTTGTTVRYATSAGGPFVAEEPLFTNVCDVTVWVEISAEGYDTATNTATVKIGPRSITNCTVDVIVDQLWTGGPIQPAVTVRDVALGQTLQEGVAYTVAYSNNVEAGTAFVIVAGLPPYGGESAASFTIVMPPEPPAPDPTSPGIDPQTDPSRTLRKLWHTDKDSLVEGVVQYDGYLLDPEADDTVAGTIKVRVGRPNRVGVSQLLTTVQLTGQKKITIKGATADGVFAGTAAGTALDIQLGFSSLVGTFGKYVIDGARNVFTARDSDSIVKARKAQARWRGTYVVAWRGEAGWTGLSVDVRAKGRVKVTGTLANGAKVSATTQLMVGEKDCAVAVSWAKKGATAAFLLWLCEDGTVACANVPGVASALAMDVRAGARLVPGAAFRVDPAAVAAIMPGIDAGLLPDGLEVRMKGTGFDIDKSGKAALNKDKNGIDLSQAGTNPSGLALRYAVKSGMFKGSFVVYRLEGGKLKKVKATVSGVVLDGKGYGTAVIRNVGTVEVMIE